MEVYIKYINNVYIYINIYIMYIENINNVYREYIILNKYYNYLIINHKYSNKNNIITFEFIIVIILL